MKHCKKGDIYGYLGVVKPIINHPQVANYLGDISAISHTPGLVRGQPPSGRTSEFTSYRQSKSGQRLGVWTMAFLEIANSGLPDLVN